MANPPESDAPMRRRILTPDQRLRVFVSSTLQELSEERRAAKAAIERLRLTPVLFELGARPYPPRALYQAYLEQSQIFVGIYWERYGWIAPNETISGLEDEYDLAADRPKLIYVKRPAPGRDARLTELLARLEADDRASYKPFETADELRELVENDLALLLTERFAGTVPPSGPSSEPAAPVERFPTPASTTRFPTATTPLVGRQGEIDDVVSTLLLDDVRLVTLLGPGGIGKTRLAMAVAERLRDAFAGGAIFVALAAVRDPDRVFDAIVDAVGLKLEGATSALDALSTYLRDEDVLLVLDNCEQVVEAAPGLARLLSGTSRLRLLVTSRVALRLSAEHVHAVSPLTLPKGNEAEGEAAELFLERARAVRPDAVDDPGDLEAIADIVRRLDGLPLAIELAASRTRFLSPRTLLGRLERRLDLLTSGPRDLPARQRTLRATLDWSFDLLGPRQGRLLVRLGVFVGGFTLAAAVAVAGDDWAEEEVLEALEGLVEHSLVKVLPGDLDGRFGMLETVREYALEKLDAGAGGDRDEVRERHATFYLALAERLGPRMKVQQRDALEVLVTEGANLRLAIEGCLARERADDVARFSWALWLFWWIRPDQEWALPWVEAAFARARTERYRTLARIVAGALYIRRGDAARAEACFREASPVVRTWNEPGTLALVRIGSALTALSQKDYGEAEVEFTQGLELFQSVGDTWGIAFAHAALARVALAKGDPGRALELTAPLVGPTRLAGDENTAAWLLHVQGLAEVELRRLPDAASHLGECLELFWRLGNLAGTAHVLATISGLVLAGGDAPRALRLAGAAEALTDAVGALPFQPERSFFETALADARARVGDARHVVEAEGRGLDAVGALEGARMALGVFGSAPR